MDNFLNLTDGQFEDQTDGLFILPVLPNDLFKQLLGLLAVLLALDVGITRDSRVLIYDAETDYFIAIADQVIHEPFQGKVGVFIGIGADQKGPTATGRLVALVLVIQGQGEIGRVTVVEGIKRDATLVGTIFEVNARIARKQKIRDSPRRRRRRDPGRSMWIVSTIGGHDGIRG